jgi:hypothetical protein
MRARLLIINPNRKSGPGIPRLILEEEGKIGLYQEDRGWRIDVPSLEEVRREHLPTDLGLTSSDIVILSEVRSLPEHYLMSSEVIQFCHSWWRETVDEWQKSRRLAKVS